MARVTVEDCLKKVENRFSLVHLTAQRTRQLHKGVTPSLECDNREVVTALREIGAGHILGQKKGELEDPESSSKPSE